MRLSAKATFLVTVLFAVVSMAYPAPIGKQKLDHVGYQAPTANPYASKEARELLQFLYEIKGRYTLTGQHNFLEDPDVYTNRVKALTGEVPALIGFEMGVILDHSEEEVRQFRKEVIREAIAVSQAGGLVTMMYHAALPGECLCWRYVKNGGISKQAFQEIVTPGTEMNKKWLEDIDEVAGYLKQLRDAKVPVLWRPYHEMNGGWFWWGRQSDYQVLWDQMFERYTNVHQLDNLLWVWSPNAPNAYADAFGPYYVGSLRADVLAVDIYDNDYQNSYHNELWRLGDGKPIAIGENGELPDPHVLRDIQHQYVWFMSWGDELERANSRHRIQEVYGAQRMQTRGDLNQLSK
jgi:mannan endo-1,4-beta-mannosidase